MKRFNLVRSQTKRERLKSRNITGYFEREITMTITKKNKFSLLQLRSIVLIVFALAIGLIPTMTYAQKGMGDYEGVGRQQIKPPVVRLTGIVEEIKTHPCEHTTGRAELGTHLIIKDTRNQELNIHLGPTEDVADIVRRLSAGKKINVLGFRTEKMPANQYVAKTLILGDQLIHLRDSMLRPYWSRNSLLAKSDRIYTPAVGPQDRGSRKFDSGYGFQRRYYPRRGYRCGQCFRRCLYKRGFRLGYRNINRRW